MLAVMDAGSMRYQTKVETITVAPGSDFPVELQVESIADFNRAIDDMFAELQARGEQDLLAELCPYFGAVWASGRALADLIAAKPASAVTGKSFLEVGCGLALPSLTLLKRGAFRVMATDLHPDVPAFLERNLSRNGLENHPGFFYRQVDWRSDEGLRAVTEIFPDRFPEVILASDVLYERGQAEAVAGFLATCFSRGTSRVILTDPGRPWLQDFVTAASRYGLKPTLDSRVVPDPIGEVSVFVLFFDRAG